MGGERDYNWNGIFSTDPETGLSSQWWWWGDIREGVPTR